MISITTPLAYCAIPMNYSQGLIYSGCFSLDLEALHSEDLGQRKPPPLSNLLQVCFKKPPPLLHKHLRPLSKRLLASRQHRLLLSKHLLPIIKHGLHRQFRPTRWQNKQPRKRPMMRQIEKSSRSVTAAMLPWYH